MKTGYIILFFLLSLKFFGQVANSDTRINAQPLTVISSDPNNPDNVIMSTAVPLIGEKFLTSQSGNLSLTVVEEKGADSNARPIIIDPNAITIPGKKYTTSQAATLKLVPIDESTGKNNSNK